VSKKSGNGYEGDLAISGGVPWILYTEQNPPPNPKANGYSPDARLHYVKRFNKLLGIREK
jgi:hypothetical protein